MGSALQRIYFLRAQSRIAIVEETNLLDFCSWFELKHTL